MRIHRVMAGENTADIAKKYGICEDILCITNEINKDTKLSPGEELLILTPTRTYIAKNGDSMTRIALRFGRSMGELQGFNPHIKGDELNAGQVVIVKCDERPYGMGVANGIYYRGCPMWKLTRALPYTTYITTSSGIFDGKKCYESFSGREIINIALENGKMPLIRVYDKSNGRIYSDRQARLDYIASLVELAMNEGYKGIDLAYSDQKNGEAYEEFLVELRGRMIGSDLILVSEILSDSKEYVSDYSDGAILSLDKCADMNNHSISFNEWERKLLEEYADKSESTKTFLELPVFANSESDNYLDTMDATDLARRNNTITNFDQNSLISSFIDKRRGRIIYNSLSNIKARLDSSAELGYMGISFDIARCPLSYLLMYDALFKSVGFANVDKRVKCNTDD